VSFLKAGAIVAIASFTALISCLTSCGKSPSSSSARSSDTSDSKHVDAPWFVEEAALRGVSFVHESGHDGTRYLIPESICGGVALLDLEGDGDLDIFLTQARSLTASSDLAGTCRQFRNDGQGRFEDITVAAGAGIAGYCTGVATGDVDNDGDTDLLVTRVEGSVLLVNDGRGGWTDVSEVAGIADVQFGSGAAFFDFDRDGDLDLIVLRYLQWSPVTERPCFNLLNQPDYCQPTAYNAPAAAVLYRNERAARPDAPRLVDVSAESGVGTVPGTGLGVVCGDFTGDGWPDIYVANDGMPNRLWVNQQNGRFTERALELGCAIDLEGKAKAGMGIAVADFDHDGDEDLMIGNLMRESDSLYRNDRGRFSDATIGTGIVPISRGFTRFGMGFVDFDNDGTLDLYEANGRINRASPSYSDDRYAEPNLAFRGEGDGKFAEVRPRSGTASMLVGASRAAAFGDIDNDGGIDVIVANRDSAPHVLHNVVPNRGHWIMFRVLDERGRDALGATVTVRVADRTIRRDVRTAYSYFAANDPRVHVGLAGAIVVENVVVTWLNGATQSFGDFDADQIVTLRRTPAR
jgi:hypothetical protein